jgi:hypothetical protein
VSHIWDSDSVPNKARPQFPANEYRKDIVFVERAILRVGLSLAPYESRYANPSI